MKRIKKSRRGSTITMVAIMLVAFLGVGAIGADIGRFYVVTSELQTAADAAALAGALALQTATTNTPGPLIDSVVIDFVHRTNHANGDSLIVTQDNVRPAFYTPRDTTGGVITPSDVSFNLTTPSVRRPNAVYVQLSAAPTGVFSQLIGQTGALSLTRSATAWIANLSANCVRPMAFPYLALYKAVSGNTAATTPAPALDPTQFVNFLNLPASQRMFVILGQNQTSALPNDGEWNGFNFTGNAGKPGFVDGITGCRQYNVGTDAANGKTLPGQANQYVNWASSTIDNICTFKNGDAGCYPNAAATVPGVVINVAWGDLVGVGSSGVDFRYVGQLMLTCYYRFPQNMNCGATKPGAPATGYPEGTMVGYILGLKSRIIDPDDMLGNTPSNFQRLILVR